MTRIEQTPLNPAARAFERLWHPLAREFAMAAFYDAGFDAGEFSGPCIASAEEDAQAAAIARVAARYGVLADQLEQAIQYRQHDESW